MNIKVYLPKKRAPQKNPVKPHLQRVSKWFLKLWCSFFITVKENRLLATRDSFIWRWHCSMATDSCLKMGLPFKGREKIKTVEKSWNTKGNRVKNGFRCENIIFYSNQTEYIKFSEQNNLIFRVLNHGYCKNSHFSLNGSCSEVSSTNLGFNILWLIPFPSRVRVFCPRRLRSPLWRGCPSVPLLYSCAVNPSKGVMNKQCAPVSKTMSSWEKSRGVRNGLGGKEEER